jgi:hypothetical protein
VLLAFLGRQSIGERDAAGDDDTRRSPEPPASEHRARGFERNGDLPGRTRARISDRVASLNPSWCARISCGPAGSAVSRRGLVVPRSLPSTETRAPIGLLVMPRRPDVEVRWSCTSRVSAPPPGSVTSRVSVKNPSSSTCTVEAPDGKRVGGKGVMPTTLLRTSTRAPAWVHFRSSVATRGRISAKRSSSLPTLARTAGAAWASNFSSAASASG